MKKYRHIAIGGTFDHFHKGQKKLIDKALSVGEKVTIGLATEKVYATKPFSATIQSFKERKKALEDYLKSKNNLKRVSIVPLSDFGGAAAKDTKLEALIVTVETLKNATKINQWRQKNRLHPLEIIKIPMIKGNDGKIIRSERIRLGEIDHNGRSYLKLFGRKSQLILPQWLRPQLQKPLGSILSRVRPLTKSTTVIISVGDVVTKALLQKKVIPSIQIIDHKKQRKEIPARFRLAELSNSIKAENKSGTISQASVKAFIKAINLFISSQKPQQIIIDGEEDLTALVAILFAPLGAVVLYGQYDLGVVLVEVTEEIKQIVVRLIRQFKPA